MILGAKRRILDASSSEGGGSYNDATGSTHEDVELEPWAEFVRRATRQMEPQLQSAKLEDWLTTWRRRQWT
eukprot:7899482-Karenia_brevis.AAC.1